jgi:4-hydroxy-3-polyprenylbenzoate decarboxylase
MRKRLVVAVSGASGAIYAKRFLWQLPETYEIHLIVSSSAKIVIEQELGIDLKNQTFSQYCIKAKNNLSIIEYDPSDFAAAVSSGSFQTEAMVVVPCSAKTLAGVAAGYSGNLTERAAAVHLKEGRPLILLLRETPYSKIMIQNMMRCSDAGATIIPATPAFYHQPNSIDDLVDFVVGRILNVLKIEHRVFKAWGE